MKILNLKVLRDSSLHSCGEREENSKEMKMELLLMLVSKSLLVHLLLGIVITVLTRIKLCQY